MSFAKKDLRSETTADPDPQTRCELTPSGSVPGQRPADNQRGGNRVRGHHLYGGLSEEIEKGGKQRRNN